MKDDIIVDELGIEKERAYRKTIYDSFPLAGFTKHVSKKHKLLMRVTTTAIFAYLLWRLFFTLPLTYGIPSLILGLLFFLAELTTFTVTLGNFHDASHYFVPELPVIPEAWYPEVDVLIPTHNEAPELLYKTINGCLFMDYPDKSKVHVWLCDDRNRPEIKALAEKFGIGYFGLTENKQAKAGNLNNAFWQTSAPLVVTFDSDMIPGSEFLLQTVPFFFLPKVKKMEDGTWKPLGEHSVDPNYKIGFVQTPQSFYNPDLFQYNLFSEQNNPNEQDFFFLETNVAKNGDNSTMYAGSNTVLSREALTDVGGFATESITEDYLTGLLIQEKGYRNFGLSQQMVHGLAPDSVNSLLSQRERWARGNIQVFKRLRVLINKHFTFWQKYTLFAGLCYWLSYTGRMIFLLTPIMSVLFDIRILDAPAWQTLTFWLPYYIIYDYAIRVFSSNTRTNHWSSVVDTIMAPYLMLPVILELFGFKQKKFVVTNKAKSTNLEVWRKVVYLLPHGLIFAATVLSIFILIRQSMVINSLYSPIILFWLLIASKDLLFAIFFMLGRKNIRDAVRFFVKLDVSVESNNITSKGYTTDISDFGLAAVFDNPLNAQSNDQLDLVLRSDKYTARMQCKVVSVKQLTDQDTGKWKYGFAIQNIDEENERQYLQLLYDRPHSMAKRFKPTASVFDDINTNIMLRTRKREFNYRKLPRMNVELPFATQDGSKGELLDFNFEYARVQFDKKLLPDEMLKLNFGQGLELLILPNEDSGSVLYPIANSKEILNSPDFVDISNKWTQLAKLPRLSKPLGTGSILKAEANL